MRLGACYLHQARHASRRPRASTKPRRFNRRRVPRPRVGSGRVGSGRVRLARIPDLSRTSLHGFIKTHIRPQAVLLTDAWQGYTGIDGAGYGHKRVSIRASTENASELLPRVHRVASLLKRWLLATHQGAVQPEQLDYYLDEFTFRYNRRDSRVRGLLFYRLPHEPVRTEPHPYELIVGER